MRPPLWERGKGEFEQLIPYTFLRLNFSNSLGTLIEKFLDSDINLSPNPVLNNDGSVKLPAMDNHSMGTIFEELVRKFNEENNEEAGEHWTPRDAVKLMANLIFLPIADKIQSGSYLFYDGAGGTGGMLTEGEETFKNLAEEHGKQVITHLYRQEINPETYAICKADMLLKGEGENADHIVGGAEWSTLSHDAFPAQEFDFMLSNSPYGKSWKKDLETMGGKDGMRDPRFKVMHDEEELSLVTRSSDGQMLFLANMASKMNHKTPLGSRIAEVHNGSSLFTGDAEPIQASFAEVVSLIEQARKRAYQAVNTELVGLYWQIGKYISRKLETAEWGEGVIDHLAQHLSHTLPGLRGFTRRNLFRMRQFYETYAGYEKVTPLVTQLPWTHNLIILTQSKRLEEREFYLRMAIQKRWGKRELERQFRQALFEHTVLHPPKVSTALRELHHGPDNFFKDAYLFEFLDLPADHSEADLHRSLLRNLGHFLTELGRDFCYIGSEYPVQVGGQDFALDLLFFHRGLNCLLAIELKVGRFQPEHLGKLEFYLEALDRDHRKAHENPAIGVLLCASKDNEVVEYALSRSLSPALIAEYLTLLPDKKLLQAKLHEFYQLAENAVASTEDQEQDGEAP